MNKTAFSTPTAHQISFTEYLTILKAQTRYTAKYTRYFLSTQVRKSIKAAKTAYSAYMAYLDNDDEDVCELSAQRVIAVSLVAMLIGFILCFTF